MSSGCIEGGNVTGIAATAADISMCAELRVSTKRRSPCIIVERGTASPAPFRCHATCVVSMNLHHTYRNQIARSSSENVTAMREARCRLKQHVESHHTFSPSIWVRGELCIPEGPLPSFIDSVTLEEALHDLPEGARLACIKCVSAWRMGHLDTTSLREYLRSFAWQSSALRQCPALAPARVGNLLQMHSSAGGGCLETSEEEPCELLSEEDMRSLMCGSG
mmetsp:Transcript_10617/g.24887  ORF Transcript_10617/g.24887 Transcript_10617/m.24887 type:complete len:221 (+) Transcript_10617:118-780(+)